MRVFKTKPFARFANREGIAEKELCEAVRRAESGLIDADLGGGVIKQRLAREGQGKSGDGGDVIRSTSFLSILKRIPILDHVQAST